MKLYEMKYIKKFVDDEEELVESTVENIGVMTDYYTDDDYLVINTNKGVLVLDQSFDVIDELIFNDLEKDAEDLAILGLISQDTYHELESIDGVIEDFGLNDFDDDELKTLLSALLKKYPLK